jgi:16S rRNA processing protein RimM
MKKEDMICVGAIVGAFGLKNDVRVKSFCSNPVAIGDYGTLLNEDGTRTFELALVMPIKGGFAARISGVQSREEAEGLRGTALYAMRDAMPGLPDDEFYHSDLFGLSVYDTGGEKLGRIMNVDNHGAGDYLEINAIGHKNTVLLPFTKAAVPTVDLSLGRVIVDPPKGVFDDDEPQEPPAPTNFVELGDE